MIVNKVWGNLLGFVGNESENAWAFVVTWAVSLDLVDIRGMCDEMLTIDDCFEAGSVVWLYRKKEVNRKYWQYFEVYQTEFDPFLLCLTGSNTW